MNHSTRRLLHKLIDGPRRLGRAFSPPDGQIRLLWAAFTGQAGALATLVFRPGLCGLDGLLGSSSGSVVRDRGERILALTGTGHGS